jgi:heme A synthase
MVERTYVMVVVVVVIVLIGMFNVFLSVTTISWHLNHDNFQFSFHKRGPNQGQHE